MCGALGEAQDLKKVPVLEMPSLGLHKAQVANGKDEARDRRKWGDQGESCAVG